MATLYWISTSSTDWGTAGNWSTGSVPVAADDVVIQGIPGSSLANIAAYDASAVTLASLTISMTYTGTIGNTGAGASTYLKVSATAWTIGTPATDGSQAQGSGRIKIDFGSVQFTGTIYNTSVATSDTGSPPVQIKGTHASNKLYTLGGKTGVATATPGETSTLTQLDVVGNSAQVVCGSGVTLTTINASGGSRVTTNSAITTLNVGSGSVVTTYGSVAVTTLNNSGVVMLNNRNGGTAATTINNYGTGFLDVSGGPAALTVGTLNAYPGSSVKVNAANPSHLTVTTTNLKNIGTLGYAA
jgi:hypothetical protein